MAGKTQHGNRREWKMAAIVTLVGTALMSVPRFAACAPTPLALVQASPQSVVSSGPLTLTASIHSRVPEGQPVELMVTVYNRGAKELIIGGSAFEESSFDFTVTDENGQAVPRTAQGGYSLTPPMSCANSTVVIKPDQTLRYRFNLARLFDLSRPRTYAVSIQRIFAPYPFPVSAPKPGTDLPPNETSLTAGPLKFRMQESAIGFSGPVAFVSPPARQTFLYMASTYSPDIVRYRVGMDGGLSGALDSTPAAPAPTSPLTPGLGPDSLATTPHGQFLYAENRSTKTLSSYKIGDDGVLSPLPPPASPVPSLTPPIPGPLLMDPKGRFLYAIGGEGYVLYSLGHGGRLTVTAQGRAPSGNAVLDATGTLLYACAAGTTGYRLDRNGQIVAVLTTERALDRKLINGLTLGERDTAVALAPSGRFAFVLASRWNGPPEDPTARAEDVVMPMRIDDAGTLVPLPGIMVPHDLNNSAYGCTSLMVDPTGHWLLVLNSALGFVAPYKIQPDGALVTMKIMPVQGIPSALFFVPGSPLLYVNIAGSGALKAYQFYGKQGLTLADVVMPASIPFGASLASASVPTPPAWGQTVNGLAVSVHLPATMLPSSQPVVLTVTLHNTTAKPLRLGTAGTDMSAFHLSLTGPPHQRFFTLPPDNRPPDNTVPLLAAGRDLLDTSRKNNAPLILPPGGKRQYRFVLSRLADLTVGGAYTVQVTRILLDGKTATSPVVPLILSDPPPTSHNAESGWTLQVPS